MQKGGRLTAAKGTGHGVGTDLDTNESGLGLRIFRLGRAKVVTRLTWEVKKKVRATGGEELRPELMEEIRQRHRLSGNASGGE